MAPDTFRDCSMAADSFRPVANWVAPLSPMAHPARHTSLMLSHVTNTFLRLSIRGAKPLATVCTHKMTCNLVMHWGLCAAAGLVLGTVPSQRSTAAYLKNSWRKMAVWKGAERLCLGTRKCIVFTNGQANMRDAVHVVPNDRKSLPGTAGGWR